MADNRLTGTMQTGRERSRNIIRKVGGHGPAETYPRLRWNGRPRACCVLDRRHIICIAMRVARGYHVVLYRSTRLIRREDGQAATSGFDSTRPPGKGP